MVELTQGRCYWRKGGAVFELEKPVYSCDSYWDLSDSSLVGLRPFLLLLFHPALPPFLIFLALRHWLTLLLHSPSFHFDFSFGHNWHYSPPVGSLANSQHSCQIIATSPLHATPVDRSLVMRALGGAITSPCSNDSECRRPTPALFGLYPFLLLICWFIVYLNKLPKRHSLGDC